MCAGGQELDPFKLSSNRTEIKRVPHLLLYETPDILLFPESQAGRGMSRKPVRDVVDVYKFSCCDAFRNYIHVQASRLISIQPEMLQVQLSNQYREHSNIRRPTFRPSSLCPLRAAATMLTIMRDPASKKWIEQYEIVLRRQHESNQEHDNYLDRLNILCSQELLASTLSESLPSKISHKVKMTQHAQDSSRSRRFNIDQARIFEQLLLRFQDDKESNDNRQANLIHDLQIAHQRLAWNRKQLKIQRQLTEQYTTWSKKLMNAFWTQLQ